MMTILMRAGAGVLATFAVSAATHNHTAGGYAGAAVWLSLMAICYTIEKTQKQ